MSGAPPLANLVQAGAGRSSAEAITDFVFMVHDVSNLYLVTTADGDLLVNTGFQASAERNRGLLAPHRTGPLRFIVLTQSHPDHFGGVAALREAGTRIAVQANYPANRRDWLRLQRFYGPRTARLWGGTIDLARMPPPPPEIEPDLVVDRTLDLELGGRRLRLLSTPDGESTDGLTVWMPDERIAFTGNLFGPVFLSVPFLSTLRGDKPRLVRDYLASLERVRALEPELLVTGHGEPIRGAARIREDLDRLHAAVRWIRDYTFDGMNAGRDVHTLMREVALPPELAIGEFHGKASWAVRAIWEQYAGWFHHDSTTSLYGVPRSSVDTDLVSLAGGADALAARARLRLEAGEALEAMHLIDVALGAEPGSRASLEVRRDALAALLARSGGGNLSETMWLRSEIAAVEKRLAPGD